MKFGRVLRESASLSPDLPELQALFAAYKQLKKAIRRVPGRDEGPAGGAAPFSDGSGDASASANASGAGAAGCGADGGAPPEPRPPGAAAGAMTPAGRDAAEAEFARELGRALAQMNELFLEKEEDCVIRVEQLEGALAAAGRSAPRLEALHREFVDFHGEVLLLVHWSILAYTATVKILKKHHKRTGLLLRAPLGNLLSQPFCSTEMMTDIAHRVEADITLLRERMRAATGGATSAAPAGASEAGGGGGGDGIAAGASDNGLDMALLKHMADMDDPDTHTSSASDLGGADAARAVLVAGGAGAAPAGGEAPAGHDAQQQQQQQQQPQQQARAGEQPPGAQQGLRQPVPAQPAGNSADTGDCSDCSWQRVGSSSMQPPAAKRVRQGGGSAASLCTSPTGGGGGGGGGGAGASACGGGSGGTPGDAARGGGASILRQAQVALTTWEHLITSASTPSTVMAQPPSGRAPTQTTESSAA